MGLLSLMGAIGGFWVGMQVVEMKSKFWSVENLKETGLLLGATLLGMAIGTGVWETVVAFDILGAVIFGVFLWVVAKVLKKL